MKARMPAQRSPFGLRLAMNVFAAAPKAAWRPASSPPATDQLLLKPSAKFQQILGFGGAFTDATCYMFNQLAPATRAQLFHELFHPSEMGLNVGRICVGSSDYSTKVYSYDEGEPDPDLTRFSIEHDREYILPVLRQAREANPDLFLFFDSLESAGWMKFNGSMLGGLHAQTLFSQLIAKYYLNFCGRMPLQGRYKHYHPRTKWNRSATARMPAAFGRRNTKFNSCAIH